MQSQRPTFPLALGVVALIVFGVASLAVGDVHPGGNVPQAPQVAPPAAHNIPPPSSTIAVAAVKVDPRPALAPLELTTIQSIALTCANAVAEQKICDTRGQCKVARSPCFPYECDHPARTCAGSCTGGGPGTLGNDARGTCQHGAQCVEGRCVAAIPQPVYAPNLKQYTEVFMPNGTLHNCWPYVADPVTATCQSTCDSELGCWGSGSFGIHCHSDSRCY